ncbi:Uncharacterised protein [Streptococcus pyogenes]|nr:Uncharacterised protein [Streptococcus pyogenes]
MKALTFTDIRNYFLNTILFIIYYLLFIFLFIF